MRARLFLAIVSLFVLASPAVGAGLTVRTPDMRPVMYEAWNFSTFVPKSSVRNVLPKQDPVELSHLFVAGELVYIIKVTKTAKDTLTPTAIEQTLQGLSAQSSDAGPAKRWEHSRSGDPWKGISRTIHPAADVSDIAPIVSKAVGGRIAFQSVCMVGLGDDSSPILTIGVIGPTFRSAEIDVLAKYMAGRTTIGLSKPTNGEKPAPPVVAKPTPPPAPAKRPKLKKTDIELAGVVESVDAKAKSLVVLVDHVTMFDAKPVLVYPVRRKAVNVKVMPQGVEAGVGVVVIGKNTGVGKPITADFIERVEVSH